MIKFLRMKDYQKQINPWLNPSCHLVHQLPLAIPSFRSKIWLEVAYLLAGIPVIWTLYFIFTLMFYLLGLESHIANVEALLKSIQIDNQLLLISLIFSASIRLITFICSMLKKPLPIYFFGFVIGFVIPSLANVAVTPSAELNQSWLMNQLSIVNILPSLFFGYLIAIGLERQFQQASTTFVPQ